MQEMNEMKNLVIQALEARGSLSQLRAQVRASVFAAIEDQASQSLGKKNAFHWENSLCQELHKTQTGMAAIELMHEFMEYFRMDYTLNVFSSESNYKKGACTRESLIKQLRIESQDKKPLLLLMLEQFTSQTSKSGQEDSSPSVQPAILPHASNPASLLTRAADHIQRLPEPHQPTGHLGASSQSQQPAAQVHSKGGLTGASSQLQAQPSEQGKQSEKVPVQSSSNPPLLKEDKSPRVTKEQVSAQQTQPSNQQKSKVATHVEAADVPAQQTVPSRSKLEHVHPAETPDDDEEFPEAIEEQLDDHAQHGAEEHDQGVVLGASDDMYISESYGYNCSVTSEAMNQFDHIEEVDPIEQDDEGAHDDGEPEQDGEQ